MDSYAPYALENPQELKFVAVAEPDILRRRQFQQQHQIQDEMCFEGWEQLLDKPKLADAVLIATQDRMHYKPAIRAFDTGYHVLLEKPMSVDPVECIKMGEHAKKKDRIFLICHVLRFTPFFTTIKRILDERRIGRLISIQHNENVAYWHQAHSFVRGHWRNSETSCPMILAKCCHDMDIMLWLAGADATHISSFGELTYFKGENAPEGAPKRCLDGCPTEKECKYYAPKHYLTDNTEWPTSAISLNKSIEARTRALREGPYGRCVYKCDNNVVDHQVVNIEFQNKVTAAFTMCAFTNQCSRTIKLMGTRGEIRGHMENNEIQVIDFDTGKSEMIDIEKVESNHGGGDSGLIGEFIRLLRSGDGMSLTSAVESVQSHIMAFAAEKSRLEKAVVNINEFIESLDILQ